MNLMDYSIDVLRVVREIRARGWKRVGLQFPEGLKPYAFQVVEALKKELGGKFEDESNEGESLENEDIEFMVSGEACYGACDLSDAGVAEAGADGMIHFGHSEIPALRGKYHIPVIFEPALSLRDIMPVVEKALNTGLLKGKVSLSTTIQHIHLLPEVEEFLNKEGIEAEIGKGGRRLAFPGQVLGCSFSAPLSVKDADTHLFIGEGTFHALGIRLAAGKRVVAADPYTMQVRTLEEERERVLRQRFAAVQALKSAREIGVVLSTLPGQERKAYASALIRLGREHGKEMRMIVASHLSPASLRNLDLKVLVSTTCPRVAIDDYSLYLEHGITICTPIEFLISLGIMRWEDYIFDSIEG